MVNLTKEQQAQYDKISSKISLAKDKEALDGYVVNLSKCMVDLSKKSNVDLCGKVARVIVALDYSGSMDNLYRNGAIQRTLNRLVPLGLSFDDNGELDVYLFENSFRKFEPLTLSNYANYKRDIIDTSNYRMGGTSYAPVLRDIVGKFEIPSTPKTSIFGSLFGKKNNTPATPITPITDDGPMTFVLFITDGEPGDRAATDTVIRNSAYTNTFIQFIGIGNNDFDYLEHLDDLKDRPIDNTGFSKLTDLTSISDEDLYTMILKEFSGWIKAKGL